MSIFYETNNFIVESHGKPEIDRLDGGHIKISPKIEIIDRTELNPQQAIELMRLTIVVGKAMVIGMKKQGIDIGRINYQDNGNWNKSLHIHLYGRAINATQQKFGEPIIPGHKDNYLPLNEQDIFYIKEAIEEFFNKEEYSNLSWGLNQI